MSKTAKTLNPASEALKKAASEFTNPIRHKYRKKYLGVIASVILVVAVITVVFVVKTTNDPSCQVSMYAELNGTKMEDGGRYNVNVGDIVRIQSSSTEAPVAFISYYFAPTSNYNERIKVNDNHVEIVIPDAAIGTLQTLYVETVAENDDGTQNTITKTGWKKYEFEYVNNEKRLNVFVDDEVVKVGSTTKVKPGSEITTIAYPNEVVEKIYYKFGENAPQSVDGPTYTFYIPDSAKIGDVYTFMINAMYSDNLYLDDKTSDKTVSESFYFEIVN